MIELRITGEKPEEFYLQAIKTLSLLIRPPKTAPVETSEVTTESETDKFPASDKVGEATPGPNPSVAAGPTAPPKRRVKGQAAAQPTDKPEDLGGVPDFLDRKLQPAGSVKAADKGAKPITEAECREQVRLTLTNFENRARAKLDKNLAGVGLADAEKKIMKDKVAYTLPLLQRFGVQKVSDLKPEQYAEFITVSKPFVDGTAE